MKDFKYYYRISKYDPTFRVNGVFLKKEWTSFSDIGLFFNGIMFSEADYYRTENQYIHFFNRILQKTSTDWTKIVQIERYKSMKWHRGQILRGQRLNRFLQDCLREQCWGKLENDEFAFETGYDYYLHLACSINSETMESIVKEEGLFLEEWSPF